MRTRFTFAFLLILIAVLPAHAELRLTKRFSVDGEVRYRTELHNLDFLDRTGYNEYTQLRSLVGFTYRTSRDVTLRFKFKESRVLGTAVFGSPSTFVEMQESYMHVKNLFGSSMGLRVGRFEMAYGRNRLMGPLNWSLWGPNAFDGLRFEFGGEASWYQFSVVKLYEGSQGLVDPTLPIDEQDRFLGVFAGSFANELIQPIVLIDFDQRLSTGQVDPNMLITGGLYSKYKRGKLTSEFDGYYQTGKLNDTDLASWLVALDLDLAWGGKMRTSTSVGFDITSGNDFKTQSPGDPDQTFYNYFGSKHYFRGYMDFFGDEYEGLIDSYFRLAMIPFRRVAFDVTVHNFAYLNLADGSSYTLDPFSPLGQEVDTRIRSRVAQGMNMTLGYSFFMPTDEFAIMNGGFAGHWSYLAYLQFTATL